MTEPIVIKKRAWQDWRWVASLAALMFAAATCTVAIMATSASQDTSTTAEDVGDLEDLAEDLAVVSETNSKALERMDEALTLLVHQGEGIDELVAFVRSLIDEQRQEDEGGQNSGQLFIDLLCHSSDPIRVEICDRLVAEGIIVVNP